MSIGLFDLDLWYYNGNVFPNLELMKIYNYYYLQGKQVIMSTPKIESSRFEKIIYFKEHSSDFIPARVKCAGEHSILFGNGFYGNCQLNNKEIFNTKPSFLPYDSYSDRIKGIGKYDDLRKSSVIRFSTNDYTGFEKDRKRIYIADEDALNNPNCLPFIKENDSYKYNFFYKITADSLDKFKEYKPYLKNFLRRLIITFIPTDNFIIQNQNLPITYMQNQTTPIQRYENLLNGILLHKKYDCSYFVSHSFSDPIDIYIKKWASARTQESFVKYYKNNRQAQEELEKLSPTIRLLLKQNPLTYKS